MTTQRFDPDAFAPVDGYSLEMYAAVCRALVRVPAGSTRQVEAALAEHALTASRSCGYHDHRNDTNNALRGTIVIR